MTSYFFLQADKNTENADFLGVLEQYAEQTKTTVYVLDRPLTDQKYSYSYQKAMIILAPRHKVSIVNYGTSQTAFEDYLEDIIEDIGSISDKYSYKSILGRPRKWRDELIAEMNIMAQPVDASSYFSSLNVMNEADVKKIDLLISLFIGSINDMSRVKEEVPIYILDKVKQKIQLFDGDQTKFIYQNPEKKRISIQGLSGTGKTELLLHKLKDLYVADDQSRIFFTCFNRILANNLKNRIPSFFNFMKVEQQIEWEQRLWCAHSWGSGKYANSGAYRYICAFYQVPFHPLSDGNFSKVCQIAINDINTKYQENERRYAFTHMFIDESQDFDEQFFALCELVTEKNVYIAGDIFQSIFDERFSSVIAPDFLLAKCYRTDPKTLMFAHGLGMGLFEKTKLRWLDQQEWKDCGYKVEVQGSKYYLSREPLRRFEDIDENFESIGLYVSENLSSGVMWTIQDIVEQNPTIGPDDIGIILLDTDKSIYDLAASLSINIRLKFGWDVNKAFESKQKMPNAVLVSNRNNAKGLEFPFVICVTKRISSTLTYRNSLYTMLTRSFIKSYLLMPQGPPGLTKEMLAARDEIIKNKQMIVEEPSSEEKEKIRTQFKYNLRRESHYDRMSAIFKQLLVDREFYEPLITASLNMELIECDDQTLTEFVTDNLKFLKEK